VSTLTPLESLYDARHGEALPLPAALAGLYGPLHLPSRPPDRPYVVANFVSSLDGVVALDDTGLTGGGEISGHDARDHMVMGLLRAVADAVIVGAGTLRADREHLWTAAHIFPPLAAEYAALRAALGKAGPPLTVVVTARGALDPALPTFSGAVPALVVTTAAGARRLRERGMPPDVRVEAVEQRAGGADHVTARALLDAVTRARPCDLVLVEGGPRLMGDLYAERLLDEQVLTLAPQVAGRDDTGVRPGLVAGRHLAPDHAVWGRLVDVRRGGSHLFLRYAFDRDAADGA
jgi:riboflavin biosynthesis pyrimidine reductase